jgi:glutathione S-transferase
MTSLNVSIVTIFARSPDEGRDLARDMRVRWALEEVGKSYDVHPVSFAAMKEAAHRAIHPFGQIPTFEDGDVCLFASAAMVMHIVSRHPGLLPLDPAACARAINWMLAAVSTIKL